MKVYKSNVIGDNYFCVDIETTGLDPKEPGAEILEIYIKIMLREQKVKEYYLQYWGDNWELTKHIHQIPKSEICFKPKFKNSPEDIALIKTLFLRCADPDDDMIFMAQYAPFEYSWFMENLGFTEEEIKKMEKIRTCDPRLIAKCLYPDKPHNLIALCEQLNIGFPEGQHDFHRADQDVNAMWQVFLELKKEIKDEDLEEYDPNTYQYDFNQKHT